MLSVSYREHKTNEYLWKQINILAAGHREPSIVNPRQAWQVVMIRSCLPSRYAAAATESRTSGTQRKIA